MPSRKHKLLIIDDDPFLMALYSQKFLEEGYVVQGAQTAEAGFEEAKRLKPEIILLDMMLPDSDGFTLCKRLKRSKETAASIVVFLSNVSQPNYREQARILGAVDYLVKAYLEPSEIVERINEIIEAKKA